jgi:hypothetical protein
MGRPVLMLAEEDYLAPIDYRDLLHVYHSSKDLEQRLDDWLEPHLSVARKEVDEAGTRTVAVKLATDLRSLSLGEFVAEYETDTLSRYFVNTRAFDDVMATRTTVFVGRRGTGKSANFLQAAERLRLEAGNLVCEVKPVTYEWQGILRVLEQFEHTDSKVFLLQAVWKFLLLTEVAKSLIEEIRTRPLGAQQGTDEWDLVQFCEGQAPFISDDFAVRLDSVLKKLDGIRTDGGMGDERRRIAESLHEEVIGELRTLLANALRRRHRVAILVDNLDKGWQRDADLGLLAQFLLGLLTAAGDVSNGLQRPDRLRNDPVPVTLAMFLRTDIFARVVRIAREPDKIPVSRLAWTNPALLCRVVEDRYVAARDGRADRQELWTKLFCSHVRGIETRDYITSRVLPRPRDMVYFCTAAIAEAVNKGNGQVSESDVLSAERVYSQFAYEALGVEDSGLTPKLEEILFQFIGTSAAVSEDVLMQRIRGTGLEEDPSDMSRYLRELSFLGIETSEGSYSYSDDPQEFARDEALASRLAAQRGTARRYEVHPAFRPYLGIHDSPDSSANGTGQLTIFGPAV